MNPLTQVTGQPPGLFRVVDQVRILHRFRGVIGEMAWSLYLLQQVPLQLNTKGAIYFSLGGSDWVSVAPGRLELCVRGQTTSCETDEIATVAINQGVFTVKRTDAKEGWFTSKGVFRFNYASLANAQLFLFVLDRLAGIKAY